MYRLLPIIVILLLFSTTSFSQSISDTLWMKNGHVLHGSVVKMDVGVLTFDADGIGNVTVKFYDILTISATSEAYRVRTTNGILHIGWISPSDTGRVVLINTIDTVEVEISQISGLRAFASGFSNRWSGLIGAGYSFTRSSDIGRINADANANYKGEQVEMNLNFTGIYTSVNDSFSREREQSNLVLSRIIAQRWSVFGSGSYQRNETLGLLYRIQTGAGLTFMHAFNNHTRFSVGGGVFYSEEQDFENVSLNSYEAPLILNFRFFKYRNPKISLIYENHIFFGITETGRIRNDSEISLNWEIINDISFNLTFYSNFDSQSPSTGEALLDYGVVTRVAYTF